jgi:hypothetical protein
MKFHLSSKAWWSIMKGAEEQVRMYFTKNYKKGYFTTTLISDDCENEIKDKDKESDVYFAKLIKEEITPSKINVFFFLI